MRADIARHKPPAGPLDVKLLPGGLVDLEFAVHILQLTRGVGLSPDLGEAIAALIAQGLVPPEIAAAHDFLTRLLVTMRLIAPGGHLPGPASCALLARALHLRDCDHVVARLDAVRQEVRQLWDRLERTGNDA